MSLGDVSVIIKTFYRVDRLELALSSLVGKGFREVIIADDGPQTKEKLRIYDKFKGLLSLKVLQLPYDSGLAHGRNEAIKIAKSRYLLIIDDDMAVTNVEPLKRVLEQNPQLGGVAGCLLENGKYRCFLCNLKVKQQYLIKYDPNLRPKSSGDIGYFEFDLIPNAVLMKRKVFKDYSWDPHYKIGFEHLDFYLAHKRLNKWKFAVVPSVLFWHYPGGSDEYLKKYRYKRERILESKRYFLKKWNLRGVIDMSTGLGYNSLKRLLLVKMKQKLPLKLSSFLG